LILQASLDSNIAPTHSLKCKTHQAKVHYVCSNDDCVESDDCCLCKTCRIAHEGHHLLALSEILSEEWIDEITEVAAAHQTSVNQYQKSMQDYLSRITNSVEQIKRELDLGLILLKQKVESVVYQSPAFSITNQLREILNEARQKYKTKQNSQKYLKTHLKILKRFASCKEIPNSEEFISEFEQKCKKLEICKKVIEREVQRFKLRCEGLNQVAEIYPWPSIAKYPCDTLKATKKITLENGGKNGIVILDNSTKLALGTLNGDLQIWDLVLEKKIRVIDAHETAIISLIIAESGMEDPKLFSCSGNEVKMWDTNSWLCKNKTSLENTYTILCLRKYDDFLLIGTDQGIILWDFSTNKNYKLLLENFTTGGMILEPQQACHAMSSSGCIFSYGNDIAVTLVTKLLTFQVLRGHESLVVALHPNVQKNHFDKWR